MSSGTASLAGTTPEPSRFAETRAGVSRIHLFDPESKSFEIQDVQIPVLEAGQILVKIGLTAICGSDLHTILGKRDPGGPLVLGHEITGTVLEIAGPPQTDGRGGTLAAGDRVTWSIAASCGNCFFCLNGLPQKCLTLFKYGHTPFESAPGLSGGFATHVILRQGTAIFKLPDSIPDQVAVFANCGLATSAAAIRVGEVEEGHRVLIQGAGLLGIASIVMARVAGAEVTVVEGDADRAEHALVFGAKEVISPSQLKDSAFQNHFDVAIEMCGIPSAVPDGQKALRIGGRYVLCGCVYPGASCPLDLFDLTVRCLRVEGLHNYTPADLARAVEVLEDPNRDFPFDRVVGKEFPLESLEEAVAFALQRKDILRVGIRP